MYERSILEKRNNVKFNDDDQEEMGRLSLSMVEGFCNDSHVKYFL